MDEKTGHDLQLSKGNIKKIGHSVTDRISDDAALKMALVEERRVKEVTRLSKLVAERAGRKTIREEDVQVVYEILESGIKR